ncbi:hypothetical protein [Seonamhaeicola maritimus]|uniref:hypothetical protein n=1 Tax=Seonamhaeicola maritimus TaxID=2591822 RepID=UPI00249401FA|nr:hypothetical protein [Seonamhaeicola maritimus]
MKKIYLLFSSLLISIMLYSQTSLVENFNYGDESNDLINVSPNWINQVDVFPYVKYATTSLTIPNYESTPVGGSITVVPEIGQSIGRPISSVNSGTVYLSALVNIQLAGVGDSGFFLHLNGTSNIRARVFVRDNGANGINFGVISLGNNASIDWGSTNYAKNTTYLIVAKYEFNTGTSKLYVLTAATTNEPAVPEASQTAGIISSVSSVSIRQHVNGPLGKIDGLRVATNWSELMEAPMSISLNDDLDNGAVITVPPETANDAKINFNTRNFVVASPSNGDGYIKWTMEDLTDNTIVDSGSIFTANDGVGYPVSNLATGNTYFLRAELVDNLGNPLNDPKVYTLTLTIEDIIETVAIPDPNFEQALIDIGIDTSGILDGKILKSETVGVEVLHLVNKLFAPSYYKDFNALSYSSHNNTYNGLILNVTGKIESLVGIEEFESLEVLDANLNAISSVVLNANTKLKELYLSDNVLTEINIQDNRDLQVLNVFNNNIKNTIHTGNNNLLRSFSISANEITNIDISQNTELRILNAATNQIKDIDISNNTKLRGVAILNNPDLVLKTGSNIFPDLNSLNVTNTGLNDNDINFSLFPNLTIFSAANNNLTFFDASKHLKLRFLLIWNNNIESLDLGFNNDLRIVSVSGNNLTYLNVRNGNNSLLNNLSAIENNLTCISVDAPLDATMPYANWVLDSGVILSSDCVTKPEHVYIPDANFEQALIDLGIDSDGVVNTSILREDAGFITTLDISDPVNNENLPNVDTKILDLTGIEAFTALVNLYAWDNNIGALDVSYNTLLEHISISDNNISELILTNNSNLTEVYFNNNAMTIFTLGNHPDLVNIHGGGNQLNTIHLSNSPKLSEVILWGSNLIELNTDFNIDLRQLIVDDNNITNIDVSNNPILEFISLGNNQLTSLNIANGNNANFTTPSWAEFSLYTLGNGNLDCIQVDAGIMASIPSDWRKSPNTIYSSDCVTKPEHVYIPDANFEQALINLGFDSDGAVNTWMLKSDAEAVTTLDIGSKNITDLTGIEAFINLTDLNCQFNRSLASIDISNNTKLISLNCRATGLSNLDVSKNIELTYLESGSNTPMTAIDLSKNIKLEAFIHLFANLETLDVSQNTALTRLDLFRNKLTNLIISNKPNLTFLRVTSNQLTNLDVLSSPNLTVLNVGNNQLANLDISSNLNLETLVAFNNPDLLLTTNPVGYPALELLNLSGIGLANYNLYGPLFPNVKSLLLNDNNLDKFNGNNALFVTNLQLNNNQIESLNLSANSDLVQLFTANNLLTDLDLRNGNNVNMIALSNGNPGVNIEGNLLTCISVDDPTNITIPYGTWARDPGVILSENCKAEPEVVLIPDPNFEQALIDAGFDNNGMNGNILLSEAEAIITLDVSDKSIMNLTGIEAFVNLETLNASNNLIEVPNFLFNTKLTYLDISHNLIDYILWADNDNILYLDVSYNQLTELIIEGTKDVTTLKCNNNLITDLNTEFLPNLELFDISSNLFEAIDVSNIDGLATFDATENPNLLCIGVSDPNNKPFGWSKDEDSDYSANSDCIAPIAVTKNVTVQLDNKGVAIVNPRDFDNGSTDNVTLNENLVFELNFSTFDCTHLGAPVELELTITDEAGNGVLTHVYVEVVDNLPPTVTAINPYVYDLNGMTIYTITAEELVKASDDNCSNIIFSIDQSSFSSPDTYTVTLTATDGSGNTAEDTVDITIEDSASSTELKFKQNLTLTVYPVPFTNEINILFSKPTDMNNVTVTLFNAVPQDAGVNFIEVNGSLLGDTSGLSQGFYTLQITISGQTKSVTIVK